MNATKEELRKKYILLRNNIGNRSKKSAIITDKLKEDASYIKANTIALYNSFGSEVQTEQLIRHSFSVGKIVVLPKVIGQDMEFYKIKQAEELIKSRFGVYEPIGNVDSLVGKEEIDLLIIPGLAFDTQKNRLGYGKGYYDHFLADSSITTIAICFEEQIIKDTTIPTLKTDVKVKKIITDLKTYL